MQDKTGRPACRKPPGENLVSDRLRAILLNARGAQTSKAVSVDRLLPGEEFLHGQRVARARLLKAEQPAAHRGDYLSLAADNPPLGIARRQIRDRQWAAVRPYH